MLTAMFTGLLTVGLIFFLYYFVEGLRYVLKKWFPEEPKDPGAP